MPVLLQKLGIALTYPPTLSLCLACMAALVLLCGRRRVGGMLMASALAGSLLWSGPSASDWLRGMLEQRYPVRGEASLPRADAVVVLGGGSRYAWLERAQVRPEDLKSSRLAAGARAWLAGRAPYVVLSGGGENGVSEARVMAAAIARLGVPASALILEDRSRSTYDNAVFTAELARRHDIRCVLLVTSALHMPRASLLFRNAGIRVVPVPVPERAHRLHWRDRWLPSRSALWRSGRAFKEYAALFTAHLRG
jgi:uncharacterized SAM-binding protein YcdF (DUF218 family)